MSWTTTPYTSRQDVILMLDPNMSTTDNAFVDLLIPIAQADIDAELGYSFQQDGTISVPALRTYDGGGHPWLWVDNLVSLVQVTETYYTTYLAGGVIWQAGAAQTTDITADIILKPNNYTQLGVPAHKLVRNSGLQFAQGTANYKVYGVYGVPYLPGQMYPGVPTDISRACARLVIHYYKMRDTAYSDMVQAQGGIREKYLKTWPIDVQRVVANYQRTRFFTHGGL